MKTYTELEHKDLKEIWQTDFSCAQSSREKAADDSVFYWITQWDDQTLEGSGLQYRGEFNILRKAGRQIMEDMQGNPISIDFEPKAESRQDGAELLDGLYRSDSRSNVSREAVDVASQDAIVCGFGAWERITEYESARNGSLNQVIKRKPIHDANNKVAFDSNSKLLDKSDSRRCSVLHAYSEDGYKDLYEDITGEEYEGSPPSFAQPEDSFVYPWLDESHKVYVASIYHRQKVDDKILLMVDPFGNAQILRESDLEDVMDDMIDQGWDIQDEKIVERWVVYKYIADGKEVLSCERVPGEYIPVIPQYGEYAIVEDEIHYEGVTRLAKDPQRLRNFMMSYIADIASRSPRPRPIFGAVQVEGFEYMYEETTDKHYPYLLQHLKDENDEDLPLGPVGMMPDQVVPQAVAALVDLTRQAVEDVANPGIPQDVADPDLSGKAIYALQNRIDNQSMVYQRHRKHALRHDAVVYASMAVEVIDSPREMISTNADGTRKIVKVMDEVIDKETGEPTVLNDLTNTEFEVYANISADYSTQKEQDVEQMVDLYGMTPEGDPLRQAIMFTVMAMKDGEAFKPLREHAKKQLILTGFKEPETGEEIAMVQAAQQQQGQQQDPNMMIAMGAYMEGQAAMQEAARKATETQSDIQVDHARVQIDSYEAETDRMGVQVDAQKAGAEITLKRVETQGKQIDNAAKFGGMSGGITEANR